MHVAPSARWRALTVRRLVALGLMLAAAVAVVLTGGLRADPAPSFREQECALPESWLTAVRRGRFEGRSGDISLLPRYPAYMASGAGGWSHSGPWPYLTHVPLVFYGPGVIPKRGSVSPPVTIADVAPTIAALLDIGLPAHAGRSLDDVTRPHSRGGARPKLVLTVVWDGGGWNVLRQWPDAWPNLRRLMHGGVSYSSAHVGSSPSVTPAVHTTLGTGSFPWQHGITGIPLRDEHGAVVDSFLRGESSRFIRVPTLAERWDARTGNRALVGMVGYEPWHLGMIGQGAERPGGDRDDAAWLNIKTNEWISNDEHYRLPPAILATKGLERDLRATDAADGKVDGAWRDNAILDDPSRAEEVPGFIHYHARALQGLISAEGYGDDNVTDLLFTNFKQIDRDGHYYNMASPEVRDTVVESDEALGRIARFLDRSVGRGNYVVVVTADHGQQPDEAAINGYGIDPNELESDIRAEFGPVIRGVWPTEAFLHPKVMAARGVTVADVARFIAGYRLRDNSARPDVALIGAGRFNPSDRIFALAVPSHELVNPACAPSGLGRTAG
jgi:arylsulfatase A-like enzyme